MFENYEPLKPHIEHVGSGWIRAFVLDEPLEIGEALAIIGPDNQRIFAEVRRYTGNRRVEAIILDAPEWLLPGLPVERTSQPVAVKFPATGDFHFQPETLQPYTPGQNSPLHVARPSFAQLDGHRPPLLVDIEPIDILAPLVERGLNLIIDLSTNASAFHSLATRAQINRQAATKFDVVLNVPNADDSQPEFRIPNASNIFAKDHPQALRIAAAWATHLRDAGKNVLFIADLPRIEGRNPESFAEKTDDSSAPTLSFGEIIDLLGQTLTSTHTAAITVLLRLHLVDTAGLEDIIETMHLGDADSQIFITSDSRFDPRRSLSRAQLSSTQASAQDNALAILGYAAAAQDRADLFGEDELDDNEKGALHQVETWAVHLG